MRPQLKIRFCDFHRHLPYSLNYFRDLLSSAYELDESADPEFVIYSNYGRSHRDYRCVRIFYSMENERPDFNECDYAITFDYLRDPRHLRLPYYRVQPNFAAVGSRCLLTTDELQRELDQRTSFCGFVHSNPFGKRRNHFFNQLSRYKRLQSGGRYRNNLGHTVQDKVEFMRTCKFGFAFENEASPGYTTEKLTDVFASGAIPIYWGNERVAEEFNRKAMLNRHEFASDEVLIKRIAEIDNDDRLWCEYRRQPCFLDDRQPVEFSNANVLRWFGHVFGTKIQPVALTSPSWLAHARHLTPGAMGRRIRRFTRHSLKGLRLATGI